MRYLKEDGGLWEVVSILFSNTEEYSSNKL